MTGLEWIAYYSAQAKAQRRVRLAVRSGALVRPEHCSNCGRRADIHAHHADYSAPLDIEWLCRSCHTFAHNALRAAQATA